MRKTVSILLALTLALSLSLVTAVPAAATTHDVGPGKSIQAAIDAANPGDTINVAAGIYNPTSTIVIDKDGLILQGPQANVDPRPTYSSARTAGSESEAIIDGTAGNLGKILLIKADNVVINGLEVKSGTKDMIYQGDPHTGTVVKYNIVHDGNGDEGVQLKKCTGGILEYNYVYDIADPGDALNISDGSSNGSIRYNEVYDIGSENAAIYVYGSTNMKIVGNLVYHVTQNDGIKLGAKGGGDASKTGGLIKDNVVYDTEQDGITVYMSGVTVEGNEVYNCRSENGAIYLAYRITDILIRGNSVHDNVLDPSVKSHVGGIGIEYRVDAANVHINNNNIYNNTPYGVNNDASAVVDAENNWWGDASGPYDPNGVAEAEDVPPCHDDCTLDKNPDGAGDKVSDNVDYCPWLEAQPMSKFVIDHAKIDFKKKAEDDKVRVQGKLELGVASNGVAISEDVIVTVGSFSETIPGGTMVEKGKKGEKWEYKRPKGGEGDIKKMTINWKNGKFDIRMDKADLSELELTDPNEVTISIQIGDDLGSADIEMREKKHHWDYKAK